VFCHNNGKLTKTVWVSLLETIARQRRVHSDSGRADRKYTVNFIVGEDTESQSSKYNNNNKKNN
jgi:hypothetical protein